jgi:hypothetical protein
MWLMHRWTVVLAAAATMAEAGCAAPGVPGVDTATVIVSTSSGDVALDSLARDSVASDIATRWLSDENILSLFGGLNAHMSATANVELQRWGSDTVRALATQLVREHEVSRMEVDSVARKLHLAEITPAIGPSIDSSFKAQRDTLSWVPTSQLDRAFLDRTTRDHQMFVSYLQELAAGASREDLRLELARIASREALHMARIRGTQLALAAADSAHRVANR